MPSRMKLLLTTSLLASIGFGSATALAQNAPPGGTNQGGANRPAVMSQEAMRQAEANARQAAESARLAAGQAAGAAQAAAAAPGQPGAAPQVTNPVLIQNQKMLQDFQRQAQEAMKKADEEARRRAQMAAQSVKPATPQTPAQLAERAEAIKTIVFSAQKRLYHADTEISRCVANCPLDTRNGCSWHEFSDTLLELFREEFLVHQDERF